jgi:hypothetical protein
VRPGALGNLGRSTPELSQVDSAKCRRSYGRAASGDATAASGSPAPEPPAGRASTSMSRPLRRVRW